MEGEVDLDDLNQKKADIKSLTEILEEKKATHKMLEGQLNRLKVCYKIAFSCVNFLDELTWLYLQSLLSSCVVLGLVALHGNLEK